MLISAQEAVRKSFNVVEMLFLWNLKCVNNAAAFSVNQIILAFIVNSVIQNKFDWTWGPVSQITLEIQVSSGRTNLIYKVKILIN